MAKRLLVVDDENDVLELLQNILEREGFEVDVAKNGPKALEVYRKSLGKRPYDLIVLDIIMPRMSGLEVLDAIRKEEEGRGVAPGKGVPVIMLSGLTESWINDAFKDGCNDYVIKPYDPDLLLLKIREMLGKKD